MKSEESCDREGVNRKPYCVVAPVISCLCASCTSLLPVVPRKSVSHSSSDQLSASASDSSRDIISAIPACLLLPWFSW